MKDHKQKFVRNGLLLILIFIIIIFTLNVLYINTIEKNKLIFRKDVEWQQHKTQIPNNTLDYAFFGDSHAMYGLNPTHINNSFNFATNGEDYVETYYKIKKLNENDGVHIKNIVLELDTHTFSDAMRTDEHLFRELNYYDDFIPLYKISNLKQKNILYIYVESKFRVAGTGQDFISYFITPPRKIKLGWINNTGNFSNGNKTEIASGRYDGHFKTEPILVENRSFQHFEKILTFANENNINIIFIKYPLSYEYNIELKNHGILRDEHYNNLFTMINETTTDYVVLDYYDLFFKYPEYFFDSDHLNYIGSEILSKKVANDLTNSSHTHSILPKQLQE